MAKSIWKYELAINDKQVVRMPVEADVLTVQRQDHKIMLWAEIDPDHDDEDRTFSVHGTGHPITDHLYGRRAYIGTVQMSGLVWHIHEIEI